MFACGCDNSANKQSTRGYFEVAGKWPIRETQIEVMPATEVSAMRCGVGGGGAVYRTARVAHAAMLIL